MIKPLTLIGLLLAAAANVAVAEVSPYLAKVYEYRPAPGQFVNEMPEYEAGDTYSDMLAKVEEQLCGAKQPGMVTLGAFGGYVVVGFDHPVVNVHGRYDFQIYGNSFSGNAQGLRGSSEPGIVEVSVDANGNGLPDDPWYELAGSEFRAESFEQPLYSILYAKPDPDHQAKPDPEKPYIIDSEYIPFFYWEDATLHIDQDHLKKVSFHTQSYWPQWVEGERFDYIFSDYVGISFDGRRLPNNFEELTVDGIASYSFTPYRWGYADNRPNNDYKGFSIDWAVDNQGNPVVLEKIDFIRIHTAVLQQCGWLGESSTEISGGEDLHPDAVYSPEWPADPIDPNVDYPETTGIYAPAQNKIDDFSVISSDGQTLRLRAAGATRLTIYDPSGRKVLDTELSEGDNHLDISLIPAGIYLLSTPTKTQKLLK